MSAPTHQGSTFDFGWWRITDGRRALLCWHPHNGEVILHHPDGRTNITLAVIRDEIELRRRLIGWAEHAGIREGLGWLAQQFEGCR